jgi:NADH-quinone oxidoreductase subunit M
VSAPAYQLPSLSLIWLLPLFGALVVRLLPESRERFARRLTVACNVVILALACYIFSRDSAEDAFSRQDDPRIPLLFGVHYHVGVDGLSALLLPVTAAISLCVLIASPRGELSRRGNAQALFALSAILGALVSLDALLLVLFWVLSLVPIGIELSRRGNRLAKAAYNLVLIGSSLPLILFLIGLALPGSVHLSAGSPGHFDLIELTRDGVLPPKLSTTILGSLVLVGALVRVGCFPLHLWIAPLSQSGLGALSMISFSTPLGIFVLARVLLPVFPELCAQTFPYLLYLSLLTAFYGAVVALGQHELQRALGFFWISQQGFLLAGLSSLTAEGTSGALLHSIETVVARTGLLLVGSAIAARAGTTDVRMLGGLVVRAPRMATGFLLLSAAAIALPGTAGFVSEDLIVHGLLRAHGLAAAVLLISTALNGILLFRLFQRIFLGGPSPHSGAAQLREFKDFLPRERYVSIVLVGLLLAGGLLARPLLSVRQSVVTALPTTPLETNKGGH